jgi:hypothetical protein
VLQSCSSQVPLGRAVNPDKAIAPHQVQGNKDVKNNTDLIANQTAFAVNQLWSDKLVNHPDGDQQECNEESDEANQPFFKSVILLISSSAGPRR